MKNPETEAEKPDAPAPAPKPEEKKPEHHSASQFEFKKPTLVINYSKFQNSSLTIGSLPLKAPDTHHQPEQDKPAPARSFKPAEKLRLEVKIDTAKEFDDAPVISLNPPETADKKAPAPARKAARPAPKKIRSAKPLKLQVRVSTADPAAEKASAPRKAAPKKPKEKSSGSGSAPDKKG